MSINKCVSEYLQHLQHILNKYLCRVLSVTKCHVHPIKFVPNFHPYFSVFLTLLFYSTVEEVGLQMLAGWGRSHINTTQSEKHRQCVPCFLCLACSIYSSVQRTQKSVDKPNLGTWTYISITFATGGDACSGNAACLLTTSALERGGAWLRHTFE